MPKIFVPQEVFPGFEELAKITAKKAEQISKFLSEFPLTISLKKFGDDTFDFLHSLKIPNATAFVNMLISFKEFILDDELDVKNRCSELAESYVELSEAKLTKKQVEALKSNLNLILSNSCKLKTLFKGLELLNETNNPFIQCKIISDIRIVFNSKIKEAPQNGLILHSLNITFRNNLKKQENIYFNLDSEDLKSLKSQLERALEKEEILRSIHSGSINFI